MRRKIEVCLQDILESCDFVITDTSSVTLSEFSSNRILQDAVIRRFEIIGEAVKHVPLELRKKYPNATWQDATAFRDVLIHDYPEIVIDEVYHTAIHDLPVFRTQIASVLNDLQKNK
jgi:uncharacterized protein with HEPN domain